MRFRNALTVVFLFAILLPWSKGQVEDEDVSPGFLDNFDDDDDITEKPTKPTTNHIISTAFVVVAVVGLLANTVVFFVIFCGNEIAKTVTAFYVLQLAIADSMFLMALPFLAMQMRDFTWAFGQITCGICQTVRHMNYYAGIFFLTAMSIDRYIAVAYSTKAHMFRTQQRARWSCVFVWIISTLASLPAMLYSRVENINGNPLCRIVYPGYKHFNATDFEIVIDDEGHVTVQSQDINISLPEYYFDYYDAMESSSNISETERYEYPTKEWNPEQDVILCSYEHEPISFYIMQSIKFIFGFVIPFLIISCCYFRIIHRLRESEERLPPRNGTRTQFMRKRVTRMVTALVICFTVCWLPYHIIMLARFKGFYTKHKTCYDLEYIVVLLGYSNSALNPLLYTFLGHDFQKRLQKSISRTRSRLNLRSKPFTSGLFFFPSRKSSQKSRTSTFRPTPVNYFQVQQNSSNASTGCCRADCTTLLARYQNGGKEGKNIPLLELKQENNSLLKVDQAQMK